MNRQQKKEAACYLAIRQGFGLIRRNTEIHAISAMGHSKVISRSHNVEQVWDDAYQVLATTRFDARIDPYELPSPMNAGWDHTEPRDPKTGFVIQKGTHQSGK